MDQGGAAAHGNETLAQEKDESTGAPPTEGDTTKGTVDKNDQPISDMDQEGDAGSLKKFFVQLAGETLEAYKEWVSKFQAIGQSEVKSREESDYVLLFCLVVTRVKTDIGEALGNTQGGKPIILIVMHLTFDPNYTTGDSKRLVENRNVVLVVDCLFYEGRLLDSGINNRAWSEIKWFIENSKKNQVRNPLCVLIWTGKKFVTYKAGETFRAHKHWVSKFKSIGQSRVKSLEESDYILLFCPIVSQVKKDISEALENTPGGKKIILIVMCHTSNPNYTMADREELMKHRDRVVLVVDCLFHKSRLLKCDSNKNAWSEIKRFFGEPEEIQVSLWSCFKNWIKENPWSLGVSFGTVAVVILASVTYPVLHC